MEGKNADVGCRHFGGLDDHLLESNNEDKKVAVADSDSFLTALNANIIGNYLPYISPYGKKPLVYADWTASGRGLNQIENYIRDSIMPFYGNTVWMCMLMVTFLCDVFIL